jgi:hypothetical protein
VHKQAEQDSDYYQLLLTDPLQVESMFTKLFYLDGEFTPGFSKLVDEGSGAGIIVWNVTWPKD